MGLISVLRSYNDSRNYLDAIDYIESTKGLKRSDFEEGLEWAGLNPNDYNRKDDKRRALVNYFRDKQMEKIVPVKWEHMVWNEIEQRIVEEFAFAEENNTEPPTLRINFVSGECVEIWFEDLGDITGFRFSHSDGRIYDDLDSL